MSGLSFRTGELRDIRDRDAAETIDRHIGHRGDQQVTEDELVEARRLIAKHNEALEAKKPEDSPFKDLHPQAVKRLEARLDGLKEFLHGETKKKTNSDPFCTSIWTTAISDDAVRTAAQAIAKALAPEGTTEPSEELSLADFLDAR